MTMYASLEPVPPSRRIALTPLRRAVATAPMRVSFAGGGSDLPPFLPGIGGRVVGTAIDLRVRVVVEPFDRGWVRLELSAGELVLTRRASEERRDEIAFRLLETALAATGVGDAVRIRVETDVVPGAGLGGSASAAVAALAALRASLRESPTPDELAVQAIRLERDGLRLVCGSQDQIFAAVGGVLDLRFDEGGLCGCDPIAADPLALRLLEVGLLLVDTGQRRVSGEVLGRAPRGDDTTAELVAAAGDVARGLVGGSLEQVIAGMRRNAAAKARRDPVANAPARALAEKLGPLGAEVVRMCGAGLGGHVLVWAPESCHAAITAALDGCTVRRPPLRAPGVRLEE